MGGIESGSDDGYKGTGKSKGQEGQRGVTVDVVAGRLYSSSIIASSSRPAFGFVPSSDEGHRSIAHVRMYTDDFMCFFDAYCSSVLPYAHGAMGTLLQISLESNDNSERDDLPCGRTANQCLARDRADSRASSAQAPGSPLQSSQSSAPD